MLVQVRRDGMRLVRQHDHALMAGALARSWDADGPEGPGLPFRVVLATALHDLAWRELDAEPRYDPDRGRPFSFDAYPLEAKLSAYRAGLNRVEEISPWAALIGSLHYASFLGEAEAPWFLASEAERRERLRAGLERPTVRADDGRPAAGSGEVGAGGESLDRRARRDLGWLKFFDGLSIRLCLTAPGGREEELPRWLEPDRPLSPPGDGGELRLAWLDPGAATLEPWPLVGPVALEVPVRELEATRYGDAGELRRAWRSTRERVWRLTLRPSG